MALPGRGGELIVYVPTVPLTCRANPLLQLFNFRPLPSASSQVRRRFEWIRPAPPLATVPARPGRAPRTPRPAARARSSSGGSASPRGARDDALGDGAGRGAAQLEVQLRSIKGLPFNPLDEARAGAGLGGIYVEVSVGPSPCRGGASASTEPCGKDTAGHVVWPGGRRIVLPVADATSDLRFSVWREAQTIAGAASGKAPSLLGQVSVFTVTFCANSANDLTCPPHIL